MMARSWDVLWLAAVLILISLGNSMRAEEPKPTPTPAIKPLPDKLVVLTFDDSVKSHFTVVRPLLRKYGFGATFFVTEGFDFPTNKQDYMTWDEIAQLHRDGFEIGNHTRDHLSINDDNVVQVAEQLEGIAKRCEEHSIPRPTSFAWPGNSISAKALAILTEHGIRFARRGGAPEYDYKSGQGWAYEPGLDHPLLIPSAGDARPDWELEDLQRAAEQARFGRIAVLQFHGVPDRAHPWVHTTPEKFETYLRYLADHEYKVVALRDLENYVDPKVAPTDPFGVVQDRKRLQEKMRNADNFRRPNNDQELAFWLQNMLAYHQFSLVEGAAGTGMPPNEIEHAAERLKLLENFTGTMQKEGEVVVMPFPGGRHPRTGFRDGAIRPQRETKLSIFLPWQDHAYVVADVPEAIWWETPRGRELLYLAHTHVPTTWDREGIELPPVEWRKTPQGWEVSRTLPNNVVFGARAIAKRNEVQLELWMQNGTNEPLDGLLVQNCVMLAGAMGFDGMSNENKVFASPFVACGDAVLYARVSSKEQEQGFSIPAQVKLLEDYAGRLDATGQDYLRRIRAAAQRMSQLIDDLLNLSRVTRSEMQWNPVNLTALAHKVMTVPGRFFDVNPRKERPGASPFSSWMRFSFGPPKANVRMGLERLAAMIASS
jgi:peptidoglycan/xylan/chitin deacetylase (PgdA/CDA1 family)